MKKLVITTACITLAGILLVVGLIYGALFLFSPKTLVRFYDRMGNYNASINLSVRCYEKSKTDDDLIDLCFVIDESKSSEIGIKYIDLLIDKENFDSICNSNQAQDQYFTLQEYFSGKLTLCYLYNGNSLGAVSFAKEFVLAHGYTQFNPFYTLLTSQAGLLTSECIEQIETQLLELLDEFEGSEKSNVQSDLALAQGL